MKFVKHSQVRRSQSVSVALEETENQSFLSNQPGQQPQSDPSLTAVEKQAPFFATKEQQIYESQILDHLISRQNATRIDPTYFCRQPDIKEHMRAILLNWLVDVHIKYRLLPETLFMTINLIDRFLSVRLVYRTQLQLVGLTALWIAAKYQETYQVPKISNLVLICNSSYTKLEILEMEGRIIEAVNFDLLSTSSLDYFTLAHRLIQFSDKDYYLARYMLEISLFNVSMHKYSPKIVAYSVIFFIHKLRRNGLSSPHMAAISSPSEEQLKPCARDICNLWRSIQLSDSMDNLRNKFLSSKFRQVAKIKLSPAVPKEPAIQANN